MVLRPPFLCDFDKKSTKKMENRVRVLSNAVYSAQDRGTKGIFGECGRSGCRSARGDDKDRTDNKKEVF